MVKEVLVHINYQEPVSMRIRIGLQIAKKLVSHCNSTCCRIPLNTLFKMLEFDQIDYNSIDFLIKQKNKR